LGPLVGAFETNADRVQDRYIARKQAAPLALEEVIAELKTGLARGRSLPSRSPMSRRKAAQRRRTEWYGANAVACQTGSKEQHESPSEQGISAEPRPFLAKTAGLISGTLPHIG